MAEKSRSSDEREIKTIGVSLATVISIIIVLVAIVFIVLRATNY